MGFDLERRRFGLDRELLILQFLEHSSKWQDITLVGMRTRTFEIATSLVPPSPDFSQMQNSFVQSLNADSTPTIGGGSVDSPRKRPGGRKLSKKKRKKKKQRTRKRKLRMQNFT